MIHEVVTMDKHRKTRIPKLKFTDVQDIGWHVSYRDPVTKTPRRYRFGLREKAREEEALAAYHRRLASHLNWESPNPRSAPQPTSSKAAQRPRKSEEAPIASTPGSVMDIASGLIVLLEARVRSPDERVHELIHCDWQKRFAAATPQQAALAA
jgi:hypothetical protein